MNRVAIYGAGDLGATVARRLAERELCRHIVLVDPDEGRAKGKALDLMQSGPVEGYDTTVQGASVIEAAGDCDTVVLADGPALAGVTSPLPSALDDLARASARATAGPIVIAIADAAPFVEAAVRLGLGRERVVGSSGGAFAGAVRHRLATALEARSSDAFIALLGALPADAVVPASSATCGGIPVDRLSAVALRRAVDATRTRALGPVALAAAAVELLALLQGSGGIATVTIVLDGEYGHRGCALTVPARVGRGRVEQVIEVPLDPIDRVVFDRGADRRGRT